MSEEKVKYSWDTGLYTEKHSYVYKFGEDVLNLLEPAQGEKILDLGCGTGHLTAMIAQSDADVTGIDSSPAMIQTAQKTYPYIKFFVADAADLNLSVEYDAVFSNAVLHWVLDKEKAVNSIARSLKPGGRFVAEFGGKGNIGRVYEATKKILTQNGFRSNAEKEIWYYPSVGEYCSLLEAAGFRVLYAAHFDRDTFLNDGDSIADWLDMFGKTLFEGVSADVKTELIKLIEDELKATNYKEGRWFIDYKRLRIKAVKQPNYNV